MTMSLKTLEEKKETKTRMKNLELKFTYDTNTVDMTGAGNPTPPLRNTLTQQQTDSASNDDVNNVKVGDPPDLQKQGYGKGYKTLHLE